jgi:hypothetical protein
MGMNVQLLFQVTLHTRKETPSQTANMDKRLDALPSHLIWWTCQNWTSDKKLNIYKNNIYEYENNWLQ